VTTKVMSLTPIRRVKEIALFKPVDTLIGKSPSDHDIAFQHKMQMEL
jgi:hypothetical protein